MGVKSMLQVELGQLTQEHLRSLLGTTQESLRLEFKGRLDLSTPTQRKEAAKDISAFANAQGGRLVYGIAERKQQDGSRWADHFEPLTDYSLKGRLADVIADGIYPPPRKSMRELEVDGGFVLVVEVYPSMGRDLHMVIHDHRFYRRGEARTLMMSEPEIREAYRNLTIASQALEHAIAGKVRERAELGGDDSQSVVIIPWFARRNLADPRILSGFGKELAEGPFREYRRFEPSFWEAVCNIRTVASGLHAARRSTGDSWDLYVTREGVVHLNDEAVVIKDGPSPPGPLVLILPVISNLLVALNAARVILSRCHYWGPVHVVQVLRLRYASRVEFIRPLTLSFASGWHQQAVPEVNLLETGEDVEPIARELCDELYQIAGQATCSLFTEDGHLTKEARAGLTHS
jgi:Putative DNA-binding domain